jgi:hypothetical protein
MSASTTSTTTGSQKARDIGLLMAAFRGHAKWDNTWSIEIEYKSHASNSTGPPALQATWTEMEKSLTPSFVLQESTTSPESPLSPKPTPEATSRFNAACKRIMIFEQNSNDATCQTVHTRQQPPCRQGLPQDRLPPPCLQRGSLHGRLSDWSDLEQLLRHLGRARGQQQVQRSGLSHEQRSHPRC